MSRLKLPLLDHKAHDPRSEACCVSSQVTAGLFFRFSSRRCLGLLIGTKLEAFARSSNHEETHCEPYANSRYRADTARNRAPPCAVMRGSVLNDRSTGVRGTRALSGGTSQQRNFGSVLANDVATDAMVTVTVGDRVPNKCMSDRCQPLATLLAHELPSRTSSLLGSPSKPHSNPPPRKRNHEQPHRNR